MNVQVARERFRQVFNLTSTANNAYAGERITFGVVPAGVREDSGIGGVTVLVETTCAAATVEMWLPRLQDGTTPASTIGITDGDFFYSGHNIVGSANGSFTHPLAAWPGAQIRVKGGGTTGTVTVDASSVTGATGGSLV